MKSFVVNKSTFDRRQTDTIRIQRNGWHGLSAPLKTLTVDALVFGTITCKQSIRVRGEGGYREATTVLGTIDYGVRTCI
jgi:hypothetical protein